MPGGTWQGFGGSKIVLRLRRGLDGPVCAIRERRG